MSEIADIAETTLPAPPPGTIWCGLEIYDPEADEWQRYEPDGLGRWWRAADCHPRLAIVELVRTGQADPGRYREVWAPKDRRRQFPPPPPFEVDDDDDDDAADTNDQAGAPATAPRQPPRPPPPRPPAKRPERASKARLLHELPFEPPRENETVHPLTQVVYLSAMVEQSRNRQDEKFLQLMSALVEQANHRAELSIAAVKESSNQMLNVWAMERQMREEARAADSVEKERLAAELKAVRDELEDVQAESIETQLAQYANQPDQAQSLVQQLGLLLQSPGGEIISDGLRRLLGEAGGGGGAGSPTG